MAVLPKADDLLFAVSRGSAEAVLSPRSVARMISRNIRKSRAAACAAVSGFLFVLLPGCGKTEKPDAALAAPEVTVARVRRAVLEEDLLVSGNLAALPNRDAKVTALVAGRIQAVYVAEGDRVSENQILAQLDSTSFAEQLRQAEAAVAQARASVENAKLSAERNEGLLQRGIAARKEVEDARTQLSVSGALLQQAEAAAAAARAQLARTIMRAPFAGTVVRRFLGVGEQVDGTGAQPIVEVANIDALELLGTVPASRLGEINQGDQISFATSEARGATFQARIVAVLPAVDPATDNGMVRVRIDNRKRLLKLGMFVSIHLPLKERRQRLLVPRQAVYPDESGQPHVYRISGDQAEFVPVELGLQTKDAAEILSGVQEGDRIILAGGYGLPEKSKVHIKQ